MRANEYGDAADRMVVLEHDGIPVALRRLHDASLSDSPAAVYGLSVFIHDPAGKYFFHLKRAVRQRL